MFYNYKSYKYTYRIRMTTAATGVIFLAKSTGRCLFQLRNSNKKYKHTWGFFGGTLMKNETPFQALTREMTEEIGFVPKIEKLNPLDIFESKDKHFYYYSFVAVVDNEFVPQLNIESAGHAWVNIGIWPRPLHQGAQITLGRNRGTLRLQQILELHQSQS